MDRLSIVLTFMTGSVLVGGLIIVILSLGLYNWFAMAAAIVVGLLLTWPTAYIISRWIKHEDPNWRQTGGSLDKNSERHADFPET